jgi:hypothetical protein
MRHGVAARVRILSLLVPKKKVTELAGLGDRSRVAKF